MATTDITTDVTTDIETAITTQFTTEVTDFSSVMATEITTESTVTLAPDLVEQILELLGDVSLTKEALSDVLEILLNALNPAFVAAGATDGIKVTSIGTETVMGADGKITTRITFEFIVTDFTLTKEEIEEKKAEINAQIAATLGLELAAGGGSSVSLSLDKHFSLFVDGVELDSAIFPNISVALTSAYLAKTPSLSTTYSGFEVVVNRADEYYIEFGQKSTKYFCWYTYFDAAENKTLEILADDIPEVTNDEIMTALTAEGLEFTLVEETVWHIYNSFGLFINGVVLEEDVLEFTEFLQAWWDEAVTEYPGIEMVIKGLEQFADVASGGLMTKVVYFAYDPVGKSILESSVINAASGGSERAIPVPDAAALAKMTFTSADGSTVYTVNVDVTENQSELVADFTTGSTGSTTKLDETFFFLVEGALADVNMEDFQRVLEPLYQAADPSYENGTLQFVYTEEYFNQAGVKYTKVHYIFMVDGKIINAARVDSITPDLDTIISATQNITSPTGVPYTFETNTTVLETKGSFVPREDLFYIIVEGPVVVQDWPAFEEPLLVSVLETNSDLNKEVTFVKIVASEESVLNGILVTTLFYELVSDGELISARSTISNVVSTETFNENAGNITDANGELYKVSDSKKEDIIRVADTFAVYVALQVLPVDFPEFNIQVTQFLKEQVNVSEDVDIDTLKAEVVIQEEFITTSDGPSFFRLGFYMTHSGGMVFPVSIEQHSLQLVADFVQVTSATNLQYTLVTRETVVDAGLRLSELYYMRLTTIIAMGDETKIIDQISSACSEDFGVDIGEIEIQILKVDEYIDGSGGSYITVFYQMSISGEEKVATSFSTVNRKILMEKIGIVVNPQGAPYILTDPIDFAFVNSGEAIQSIVFNRPIPVTDKETFRDVLIDMYVAALVDVSKDILSVDIIRDRECMDKSGSTVWVVDFFFFVEGVLVSSEVAPDTDTAFIAANAPEAPFGDPYTIIDIAITDIFEYKKSFGLSVTTSVRSTEFVAIGESIKEAYIEIDASLSAVLEISVIRVEEIIDVKTSISSYNVLFFAFIEEEIMDSTVNLIADIATVNAKITAKSVTGPNGAYVITESVTATSMNVTLIRREVCGSVVIKESISMRDFEQFGTAILDAFTLILDGAPISVANVTVIQYQELVSEEGEIFTEVIFFIVDDADELLLPLHLPSITIAGLTIELEKQVFVSGLTYVAVDLKVEGTVTFAFRQSVSLFFADVAVLADGLVTLKTNLITAFSARAEFSGKTIDIIIPAQEECAEMGTSNTIWSLVFVVKVDGVVFDSQLITILSDTELTTALSFVMTGTQTNYIDLMFSGDVSNLVKIRELFTITMGEMPSPFQFPDFGAAVVSLLADIGFTGASAEVLTMNIVIKEEIESFSLLFVIKSKTSAMIRGVDIGILDTGFVGGFLNALNLKAPSTGVSFTVVDTNVAVFFVKKDLFFSTFAQQIQTSNLELLAGGFAAAFVESQKAFGVTIDINTVTVDIQIVDDIVINVTCGLDANMVNLVFSIHVDGDLVNPVLAGGIAVADMEAAMGAIQIPGLTGNFGGLFVSLDADAPFFLHKSLFAFPAVDFIKGLDDIAEAEGVFLAALLVQFPELDGTGVTVKIASLEEVVTIEGEFAIRVNVALLDQSLAVIDRRMFGKLDLAALKAAFDGSSLNGKIDIMVDFDLEAAFRLALSMELNFDNKLTEKDIEFILGALRGLFANMPGFENANVFFATVDETVDAEGNFKSAFRFFVELDGQLVFQNVDLGLLQGALGLGSAERGGQFNLIAEGEFKFYHFGFSFYMNRFALSADIERILLALQEQWKLILGDGITVVVGSQEEVFAADGSVWIKFSYFIESESGLYDGRVIGEIDLSLLQLALTPVTVTGTTEDVYKDFLVNITGIVIIRKEESCQVILEQLVAESNFVEFEAQILAAHKEFFDEVEAGLGISILGQDSTIFNTGASFAEVFSLYYKAEANSVLQSCPDLIAGFQTILEAKIDITGPTGMKYVVSSAAEDALISKDKAFEFILTGKISLDDIAAVETALIQQWLNLIGENVKITITLQEEMVDTTDGSIHFKILFVVNDGDLSSQLVIGLDDTALNRALDTVPTTMDPLKKYADLVFTGDLDALLRFDQAFMLFLTSEARPSDFATFEASLKVFWEAQAAFAGKTITISVVTQEEVLDALSFKNSWALVYFIMADDELIDSRSAVPAAIADLTVSIQVPGPNGNYILTDPVNLPVWRMTFSQSVVVKGLVPGYQKEMFADVLKGVWTTHLAGSEIIVGTLIDYIFEQEYYTRIAYFVTLEGVRMHPGDIAPVDKDTIQAAMTFNDPADNAYIFIDLVTEGLFRETTGFELFTGEAIYTVDIEAIAVELQAAWIEVRTDLTSLTLTKGLQEEMSTKEGQSYFRYVYFLSHADGILNAAVEENLPFATLQTKLGEVAISGQDGLRYGDLLEPMDTNVVTLLRLAHLSYLVLDYKAAVPLYTQFETAIALAWKEVYPEFAGVVIKIVTQHKYVTSLGTRVYVVYFDATSDNIQLLGRDFKPLTYEVISKHIGELETPLGGSYVVVKSSITELTRYISAFFLSLTQAVKRVDEANIQTQLENQWKTIHSDAVVTISFQDEFIEESGASVYALGYYVYEGERFIDSIYEIGLDESKVVAALQAVEITGTQATKYNTVMFEGDFGTLVAYSELIQIPILQKVSEDQFGEVEGIILEAWKTIDSAFETMEIKIRTQEDYLDDKGSYLYMILYSVTFMDQTLTVFDLPSMNIEKLNAIEDLTSSKNENYQLSDTPVAELRRYKLAMFVFFDLWVSQPDVDGISSAIQATMAEANEDYATIEIEMGVQEWWKKDDKRIVKFVFFGVLQNAIIDGNFESFLDMDALTAKLTTEKYSIISTTELEAPAYNFRYSFILYVEGRVADADLSLFDSQYKALWDTFLETSLTITHLWSAEAIGKDGETLTAIYFILENGDMVVDPAVQIDPKKGVIDSSITFTSTVQEDVRYAIYHGDAFLLENQFILQIIGEWAKEDCKDMTDATLGIWKSTYSVESAMSAVQKVEPAIGAMGVTLSLIRFSVSLDGVMTFPANHPMPDEGEIQTAILETVKIGVQFYTEEATRVEDMFSLSVAGLVDASNKGALKTEIEDAWLQFSLDNSFVDAQYLISGRFFGQLMDLSNMTNTIVYRVKSDGTDIMPFNINPPMLPDELLEESGVLLQVKEPVLRYRYTKVFEKIRWAEQAALEGGIADAWNTRTAGAEVVISIHQLESYATIPDMVEVTRIGYTVSVNGEDPAGLNFEIPRTETTDLSIENAGFNPCNEVAYKVYITFLDAAPEDLKGKEAELEASLAQAWATANPESSSTFVVTVKTISTTQTRRRRQTDPSQEVDFQDQDGNTVTPVEYTVSADGSDPNSLFYNEPQDDDINQNTGASTCGCTPSKCSSIVLEGVTADGDRDQIAIAVKEAYLAVNPDITAEDINVEINDVDNTYVDANSEPVSMVYYCITRLDDPLAVNDLVDPNGDAFQSQLDDIPRTLADPPYYEGDGRGGGINTTTIIVLCVVLVLLALVIVLLAIVKVCYRHSRRKKEDEIKRQHDLSAITHDEEYAGRGTFLGTFKSSFYNNNLGNNSLGRNSRSDLQSQGLSDDTFNRF